MLPRTGGVYVAVEYWLHAIAAGRCEPFLYGATLCLLPLTCSYRYRSDRGHSPTTEKRFYYFCGSALPRLGPAALGALPLSKHLAILLSFAQMLY